MSDKAAPEDAAARQAAKPVICYDPDQLSLPDMPGYRAALDGATAVSETFIPAREARCVAVPAGQFFAIESVEGPQVGDLNLWAQDNLEERHWSGKTRALFGTHVTTGNQLWSVFPYMRPMATIVQDDLHWYGIDDDGGSVHDVIGTRCDPYTHHALTGQNYDHCCHSNLTRALAAHTGKPAMEIEHYIHDVLNVFMCTGFTRDTGQYFMKASPVRPGDRLVFLAEIDLLIGLSACPGGDCGSEHSSDVATCHPLKVEVLRPNVPIPGWSQPKPNGYGGGHGL